MNEVKPRRRPAAPEHNMQVAVFRVVAARAFADPLWDLIYAVPNGGDRNPIVGAKMKAEGVKPGVPDVCWPIARHGYHGLYVELKCKPNKPSDKQLAWLRALQAQGYCVGTVWDNPNDVIAVFDWYINGEITPCGQSS